MFFSPRKVFFLSLLLATSACGARSGSDAPPALGDTQAPGTKPAQAGQLRVPTAAIRELVLYMNGVHNRVHPLFADEFFHQLSKLPPSDPANDPSLDTVLFLAISADGHFARLDIAHSSGVPAFDAGAASAMTRAAPLAIPPVATRSFDGNTYMRWDFHRDDVRACSLLNLVPFRFVDDGELQYFLRHVSQMTPLKPQPPHGPPGAHGVEQGPPGPEVTPAPGDVQL